MYEIGSFVFFINMKQKVYFVSENLAFILLFPAFVTPILLESYSS